MTRKPQTPLTQAEIATIKTIEAATLRLTGRTPVDIVGTPEAALLANSTANFVRRNRKLIPDRTR